MATTKQVKMLLARAAEAGVKAEWSDFTDLDNGEIDSKLEEFEQLKKGQMVGDGQIAPAKQSGLNSMRFGMCVKLVAKHKTIGWCIAERAQFASQVLSLYNSVTYAEKVVAEKAVKASDVAVAED